MLNSNIFRAYDIRGIVPSELDGIGAYLIGRAYAVFLKERHNGKKLPCVIVQSGARGTALLLKGHLIKGLVAEGLEVIDGGFSTTPMHYFSINYAGADGGVMVTASHNPPEYNGFKLSLAGAIPISKDSGMGAIKSMALRGIFRDENDGGAVSKRDFKNAYIDFLMELVDVPSIKPFNAVIDAGNGMAGYILPDLLKRLAVQTTPLYFDIDMSFPHHLANPMDEATLADLKARVKGINADIGIAFDGDGDRIGFVDENGLFIHSDYVAAFIAEMFLRRRKGEKIVYDVRSSRIVSETIIAHGGVPIESKVGHSFIKPLMKKENAVFGGELSGHFYYRDFFFADAAILTMLYVLAALSRESRSVSAVFARYKKYHSSGELNFTVQNKETLLEKIASHFNNAKDISWLDGLTIKYDDWWFNVRPSNTEPLLRLNVEADSVRLLREKTGLLKDLIKK